MQQNFLSLIFFNGLYFSRPNSAWTVPWTRVWWMLAWTAACFAWSLLTWSIITYAHAGWFTNLSKKRTFIFWMGLYKQSQNLYMLKCFYNICMFISENARNYISVSSLTCLGHSCELPCKLLFRNKVIRRKQNLGNYFLCCNIVSTI